MKHVTTPKLSYSKRLSDEEFENLVIRLRQQDTSSVEPLVKDLMRLAVNLAKKNSRAWPQLRDEMLSTALCELVAAVRRAATKLKDNNLKAYVARCIISRIRDCVKYRHLIRIPDHSGLMPVETCAIECARNKSASGNITYDLIDLIYSVAQTEAQRNILILRSQGYTDKETAAKLEMPLTNVNNQRRKMNVRYTEACHSLN